MICPKVYFNPINKNNLNNASFIAKKLLEKVIEDNNIVLQKEIPLKIHPGEPGNQTFIKPENYQDIINYLLKKQIKTYFIETNTVTGRRSDENSHLTAIKHHNFTQIPFIIADGEAGFDHVSVPIKNGRHFKECKIGRKLAKQSQIIVLSHFKGHILSGFGGAIKNLGVGFASKRGKIEMHSRQIVPDAETINWGKTCLYSAEEFRQRSAEYAAAAVSGKKYIYLNFVLLITENCDCDGHKMTPIYDDLGIFAATDPVAIDKACFDELTKREGKKPFEGDEIFIFAEKIGLGSQNYQLIKLEN